MGKIGAGRTFKDCLTTGEAAKLLGVKRQTIRKLIKQGKLSGSQIMSPRGFYWIHKKDMERFIRNNNYVKRTENRPVCQYDKGGNLIKIWDTAKEASIAVGCCRDNIYVCCRGQGKTAKGYKWAWANIEKED